MSVEDIILTFAILLAAGLAAEPVARILRLPVMLVLIGFGSILGPELTGAVDVPLDSTGAQLLLTLGVSVILFNGGLQLSLRVLQQVAVGLGLLSIAGVIITAALVGVVASLVFDVPMSMGLLIGAVLAPTDPAILIPLFERLRLRPKVAQTVIAESALNDPIGAVLALALSSVVLSGESSFTEPVLDFVTELAISLGLGVAFGIGISLIVSTRRFGIWRETAAIAMLLAVSASYVSVGSAGGSGYLGAFLAGLIVGNIDTLKLGMHSEREQEMRTVIGTVAEVMVMLVFLVLGANLPWGDLADEIGPALAVLATLIFVARPLAVLACILPDRRGRWTRNETIFVAWTRETGVLPAALAGIMVSLGIPDANLVVICVALAVILTLALQATTKGWLARRLDLLDTSAQEVYPPPGNGRAG
ncbi:MAG: cation:proton antiporter [Gaiellales bacterium]